MSESSLIVVIAVAIIGVLLIVSFNVAWYQRQKQKNKQQQKLVEFESKQKEQHIPAQSGSPTFTNEPYRQKQNQAEEKVGTPATNIQYDERQRETAQEQVPQEPIQMDRNVHVPPSFKWWLAEHVSESAIEDLVDSFNKYEQNPNILGWVAWDEQIICANRHYDQGFLNAVSSYISAVAHLQKELHMKQLLIAKMNGSDGSLLLRQEKKVWIALIVEDESKLTLN